MCSFRVFHGHRCHQVLIATQESNKKARRVVERAAKAVYKFLKNESPLRQHLSHNWWRRFVSNDYCKVVFAAVRGRKGTKKQGRAVLPAWSVEEFVRVIQARLCG